MGASRRGIQASRDSDRLDFLADLTRPSPRSGTFGTPAPSTNTESTIDRHCTSRRTRIAPSRTAPPVLMYGDLRCLRTSTPKQRPGPRRRPTRPQDGPLTGPPSWETTPHALIGPRQPCGKSSLLQTRRCGPWRMSACACRRGVQVAHSRTCGKGGARLSHTVLALRAGQGHPDGTAQL